MKKFKHIEKGLDFLVADMQSKGFPLKSLENFEKKLNSLSRSGYTKKQIGSYYRFAEEVREMYNERATFYRK